MILKAEGSLPSKRDLILDRPKSNESWSTHSSPKSLNKGMDDSSADTWQGFKASRNQSLAVGLLLPQLEVLLEEGIIKRALVQAPHKRIPPKEVLVKRVQANKALALVEEAQANEGLVLVKWVQAREAPEAPTYRVQVKHAQAIQTQEVLQINLLQRIEWGNIKGY